MQGKRPLASRPVTALPMMHEGHRTHARVQEGPRPGGGAPVPPTAPQHAGAASQRRSSVRTTGGSGGGLADAVGPGHRRHPSRSQSVQLQS